MTKSLIDNFHNFADLKLPLTRSQEVFSFTNSILIIRIRIKITLFSLFGINLLFSQIAVGFEFFPHSFRNILIGQQFITICDNFQIFRTLNSNIIRFFSLGEIFLNLKNITLNLFRLLGNLITRELNKLRTLRNIRVFRIATSLVGKSFIEISLRIGNFLFVLHTHHLNRGESRVVG